MPREILIELKGLVGKGGVSQYIAQATAKQMREDALREWMARAEAHGAAIDEEYAAEIDAAFERAAASLTEGAGQE